MSDGTSACSRRTARQHHHACLLLRRSAVHSSARRVLSGPSTPGQASRVRPCRRQVLDPRDKTNPSLPKLASNPMVLQLTSYLLGPPHRPPRDHASPAPRCSNPKPHAVSALHQATRNVRSTHGVPQGAQLTLQLSSPNAVVALHLILLGNVQILRLSLGPTCAVS